MSNIAVIRNHEVIGFIKISNIIHKSFVYHKISMLETNIKDITYMIVYDVTLSGGNVLVLYDDNYRENKLVANRSMIARIIKQMR